MLQNKLVNEKENLIKELSELIFKCNRSAHTYNGIENCEKCNMFNTIHKLSNAIIEINLQLNLKE